MGYWPTPSPRERAKDLIEKRNAIEIEIQAIAEVLEGPNGPGIRGNLVDADGYPRSDINIVSVLAQRNRLAVLRTDHALLTEQIEGLLHIVLAKPAGEEDDDTQSVVSQVEVSSSNQRVAFDENSMEESSSRDSGTDRSVGGMNGVVSGGAQRERPRRSPFAIVDEVHDESPACEAGLTVNDRIVVFGAVSLESAGSVSAAMRALPPLLVEYENRELEIQVHRQRGISSSSSNNTDVEAVDLKLTPKQWSGRGLLGCHIAPAPQPTEDSRYVPEVATATLRHRPAT